MGYSLPNRGPDAPMSEQYHDDDGLTFPAQLAPFDVVVVATNMDQPAVVDTAERLYGSLGEAGLAAVFDDREVTAGVKFADADLIGYPVQVVVGKKGLQRGEVEFKLRSTGERSVAPLPAAVDAAVDLLAAAP